MNKRLLVCDLDNTLYDWVYYFVSAFYAMIDEAVRVMNCDRDRLLDDFRHVHTKHHDSEHPFSLLETKIVREHFPNQSPREIARYLDSAFHAFNSARKRTLKLYPSVYDSLEALSRSDIVMVAHTESKLYAVIDRLTRLELTHFFRRIYCRERASTIHPDPKTAGRWLSRFPMEKVVELSHHQRKPDPDVLLEICQNENIPREETAYVGDSMARDILMAKSAQVYAIWAKYGAFRSEGEYEKLVRITHWTAEDVEREQQLKLRAKEIEADFILRDGFREILDVFDFDAEQTTAIN